MFDTPVVFCVFNRPEHTRRSLAVLEKLQPRHMFVVADGPRDDFPDDARLCRETIALVKAAMTWPGDFQWNVATENLGCRVRIQSGLDWVFDQVDEAIVLEDDCVPDLSFFDYCRELLDRYRDEHRIGIISGSNLLSTSLDWPHSYLFSRYPMIWGWAAWKRTWKIYDRDMNAWPALRDSQWLRTLLDDPLAATYWRAIFNETRDRPASWDYQLVLSLWRADVLSIHPRTNLVSNIGYGEQATHTHVRTAFADLPCKPLATPLAHPQTIERFAAYDRLLETNIFSGPIERALGRAREAIQRRNS
jgi:hypothetical protein